MANLPKSVRINEEGPREGFQIEKGPISTDDKVRLVDALSETGVKQINVTSFVSPKWVPQMADAEEVAQRFQRKPGVTYTALWLNEQGFERAKATGKFDLRGGLPLVASDTFGRKNQNRGIDDMINDIPGQIATYRANEVAITGALVMAAFGCNYEGDVPLARVLAVIARAREKAAEADFPLDSIGLADTMGWANPAQVKRTLDAVWSRWPDLKIPLHLHDTRGLGVANCYAALELGIDHFDSSVAGLGGCPFAGHKGAAGNVCTEDLVFMCHELGIETGIDLDKMIACARLAEEVVGHDLPGKVMKGGNLQKYRDAASVAVKA